MLIDKTKIEEVYRCAECDESFADRREAAYHCVNEDIPREYKCLYCGFVWPTIAQAIRCYDIEQKSKVA